MKETHEKLIPGCRVMVAREHLRNTGQYTGPEAPTHIGPFARGKLVVWDDKYLPSTRLAKVLWDNGKVTRVNPGCLWPCEVPEPS